MMKEYDLKKRAHAKVKIDLNQIQIQNLYEVVKEHLYFKKFILNE